MCIVSALPQANRNAPNRIGNDRVGSQDLDKAGVLVMVFEREKLVQERETNSKPRPGYSQWRIPVYHWTVTRPPCGVISKKIKSIQRDVEYMIEDFVQKLFGEVVDGHRRCGAEESKDKPPYNGMRCADTKRCSMQRDRPDRETGTVTLFPMRTKDNISCGDMKGSSPLS